MYLGTQFKARDDDEYRVMAQLGVRHICADPAGNPHDWTLDDLKRHRERMESFGLVLDMVQLPLTSRPIERAQSPDILWARAPTATARSTRICRLIESVAAAGIPAAKYNLNIIGIPRTPDEPGRGGSRNAAFRWDQMDQERRAGHGRACSPRTRTGSASTTSSSASSRSRRATRSASPATRTTPTRRRAIAA